MEIELERYDESIIKGKGPYKNLEKECYKLHEIVENNEFMKKNWNRIVLLTHSSFKKTSERIDEKTTNAYWKMLEIWNHFKFSFSEIRHFDIACAPGFFIFAMMEICKRYNLKYSFNGFTLENGLQLDPDLKDSENIFFHDILKGEIDNKYYRKYNFVTGDIGTETSYDKLEELQLLELERKQMENALKIVEVGGSVVLKMFTFSQKESILLVDEFSKHFDKSYIYKPLSSRVLNNESYLIGISYGEFSKKDKGSNAERIEYFEEKRQEFRIEILEAATKIVNLREKQFKILNEFGKIVYT